MANLEGAVIFPGPMGTYLSIGNETPVTKGKYGDFDTTLINIGEDPGAYKPFFFVNPFGIEEDRRMKKTGYKDTPSMDSDGVYRNIYFKFHAPTTGKYENCYFEKAQEFYQSDFSGCVFPNPESSFLFYHCAFRECSLLAYEIEVTKKHRLVLDEKMSAKASSFFRRYGAFPDHVERRHWLDSCYLYDCIVCHPQITKCVFDSCKIMHDSPVCEDSLFSECAYIMETPTSASSLFIWSEIAGKSCAHSNCEFYWIEAELVQKDKTYDFGGSVSVSLHSAEYSHNEDIPDWWRIKFLTEAYLAKYRMIGEDAEEEKEEYEALVAEWLKFIAEYEESGGDSDDYKEPFMDRFGAAIGGVRMSVDSFDSEILAESFLLANSILGNTAKSHGYDFAIGEESFFHLNLAFSESDPLELVAQRLNRIDYVKKKIGGDEKSHFECATVLGALWLIFGHFEPTRTFWLGRQFNEKSSYNQLANSDVMWILARMGENPLFVKYMDALRDLGFLYLDSELEYFVEAMSLEPENYEDYEDFENEMEDRFEAAEDFSDKMALGIPFGVFLHSVCECVARGGKLFGYAMLGCSKIIYHQSNGYIVCGIFETPLTQDLRTPIYSFHEMARLWEIPRHSRLPAFVLGGAGLSRANFSSFQASFNSPDPEWKYDSLSDCLDLGKDTIQGMPINCIAWHSSICTGRIGESSVYLSKNAFVCADIYLLTNPVIKKGVAPSERDLPQEIFGGDFFQNIDDIHSLSVSYSLFANCCAFFGERTVRIYESVFSGVPVKKRFDMKRLPEIKIRESAIKKSKIFVPTKPRKDGVYANMIQYSLIESSDIFCKEYLDISHCFISKSDISVKEEMESKGGFYLYEKDVPMKNGGARAYLSQIIKSNISATRIRIHTLLALIEADINTNALVSLYETRDGATYFALINPKTDQNESESLIIIIYSKTRYDYSKKAEEFVFQKTILKDCRFVVGEDLSDNFAFDYEGNANCSFVEGETFASNIYFPVMKIDENKHPCPGDGIYAELSPNNTDYP